MNSFDYLGIKNISLEEISKLIPRIDYEKQREVLDKLIPRIDYEKQNDAENAGDSLQDFICKILSLEGQDLIGDWNKQTVSTQDG